MEYSIVKVDKNNYLLFDEMVFYRKNGRERSEKEKSEVIIDNMVYETLEDKNLYVFAAKMEEKFIGWVSAVYIPKISWTNGNGHLFIDELWVNPNYRRKGIGHALMEKIENIAKEINVIGLRLYANNEGKYLYEKCGYKSLNEATFMEKILI